jgi:hypothetical protein
MTANAIASLLMMFTPFLQLFVAVFAGIHSVEDVEDDKGDGDCAAQPERQEGQAEHYRLDVVDEGEHADCPDERDEGKDDFDRIHVLTSLKNFVTKVGTLCSSTPLCLDFGNFTGQTV